MGKLFTHMCLCHQAVSFGIWSKGGVDLQKEGSRGPAGMEKWQPDAGFITTVSQMRADCR